ncbi:MAG: alpha/beta hydrolase [Alphaproteobacteria bacterium]
MGAFACFRRVTGVDLRGFGRSEKLTYEDVCRIRRFTDDIIALAKDLDAEKVDFLGTSRGGFTVAQRAPAPWGRLILGHTGPKISIPADIMKKRLRELTETVMDTFSAIVARQTLSPDADPILIGRIADMIVRNDPMIYRRILLEGLSNFDVTDPLKSVARHSLVLTGQYEKVIPPFEGKELACLLPNIAPVRLCPT